ncbi:hypothetical protein L596_005896 [Steinernema carpocapsae]|nr:hypothetical protein L596_005896 [Steinernema carpocapsae]
MQGEISFINATAEVSKVHVQLWRRLPFSLLCRILRSEVVLNQNSQSSITFILQNQKAPKSSKSCSAQVQHGQRQLSSARAAPLATGIENLVCQAYFQTSENRDSTFLFHSSLLAVRSQLHRCAENM